jgi:hypothetical protein
MAAKFHRGRLQKCFSIQARVLAYVSAADRSYGRFSKRKHLAVICLGISPGSIHMSIVKLALVAAFAFTASVSVGSVMTSSAAEAAAAKPAPGKCGVGKFYNLKTKKCVEK